MLQRNMTRGASPTGGILPVVKDGRLRRREVLRDCGPLHQSHEPRLRRGAPTPIMVRGGRVNDAVLAVVVRGGARRDVQAVPVGGRYGGSTDLAPWLQRAGRGAEGGGITDW